MRLKTFSAVILFIVLTSLFSFSQQTDIPLFSTFGGFSYYATPSLNLVQRGVDADFGVNVRPWLTLGFDFSYGDGGSTLFPNKLAAPVQAQLAPIISTLPPGFVLAVPFSAQDYTYEAGPQFNYRHFKHVTLFARPALGAIHVAFKTEPQACGQPQLGCQIILTQILNQLVGPTLSKSDTVVFYGFGGGLTWEITPNFGIRAATDFVHENFFSGLLDGGRNSFRVTVGTKFSFGKNIVSEGAPPSVSCSASPTEAYPGDPVTATMNAQNFNPKHTVAYSWSGAGGKLSATSATATIDTTGLTPGTYAAIGTATDPKEKKNNTATCSANFTVRARPMNPPQVSCSASPSTVKSGDPSTITASASSPDNAQITGYAYQASAGRISGTGTTATLDTTGSAVWPDQCHRDCYGCTQPDRYRKLLGGHRSTTATADLQQDQLYPIPGCEASVARRQHRQGHPGRRGQPPEVRSQREDRHHRLCRWREGADGWNWQEPPCDEPGRTACCQRQGLPGTGAGC